MKRTHWQIGFLAALWMCVMLLSACGAAQASQPSPEEDPAPSVQETTAQEDTQSQEEPTLESLLGDDYVNSLTETITMQMGNRMEKNPDVRYYPIEDNAPLSDYVTIDETTNLKSMKRAIRSSCSRREPSPTRPTGSRASAFPSCTPNGTQAILPAPAGTRTPAGREL